MNFRSVQNLVRCLAENSHRFRRFDLIVGVPRSGLMAASLVALHTHRPVMDIGSFLAGMRSRGGARLPGRQGFKNVLVLDDSVNTGAAIAEAKKDLAGIEAALTFACVYMVPGSEHLVDFYCELLPQPRIFEWNVFHHTATKHYCLDMDGVLCEDPSTSVNDDGHAYRKFIADAAPLNIPSKTVGTIVTCRLEKYREQCESWLEANRVRFRELVMMPFENPADRRSYGHARFKAEVYLNRPEMRLFIESSDLQAREICRISDRPVLSVENMVLYTPDDPFTKKTVVLGHDSLPRTPSRRRHKVHERFVILARQLNEQAENLREILSRFGKVEIVIDKPYTQKAVEDAPHGDRPKSRSHPIYIGDEHLAGFGGLMGRDNLPILTAWSRALAHLENSLREEEAVWFVEDDVAGDASSFAEIVQRSAQADADLAVPVFRSRNEDKGWFWWSRADKFFPEPCRSFQPLCRASSRLIRAVLAFRKLHGSFIFHELLFASVARQQGMSVFDWGRDPYLNTILTKFRYRPRVRTLSGGVSHPVKDPGIHKALCFGSFDACNEWQKYEGRYSGDWYLTQFSKWKRHFSTNLQVRILEIGSGEGIGANVMLETIFTHKDSEVHSIELFDGTNGLESQEAFARNVVRGNHATRIHLYEGTSAEILSWMASNDGYWETFDFVHIRDAVDSAAMLSDACQAWNLLRPGGVMIFKPQEKFWISYDLFRIAFAKRIEDRSDALRLVIKRGLA